ncbi:MAG: C1 family peptidase [Bacteroidales bacterium]|jgi:bleomycin hydrolase|nr:C1 family peptidase [Bacteroidales bacterium]MBR3465914.1 C1 family peptidase [Bacteroidales bacterium]MBR4638631.1 C1 family peptidase [Bacteroidales bacterium]MBR6175307.1 C1 family peptidase [Bacteroidales bacterium]
MKKLSLFIVCAAAFMMAAQAQNITKDGGLSMQQINMLRGSYQSNPTNKALRNAINSNDISKLAVNYDNNTAFDEHLSNTVPSKAITNQESSGRCWMFTGMNVLRNKAIRKYDLPADFQFSQCYTFFWDQLEKANLFLQSILDTRAKSMEDETVQWLFKNPIGDGGQFTGVANLMTKYGVVPKEAMPETYNSNHTSRMSELIKLRLREDGLRLRQMANNKGTTEAKLQAAKMEMLETIYRMLAYTLGEPPTEFTWTQRNSKGEIVSTEKYTPMSFFNKFVNEDFSTYYMVMNDPTREYYKVYEIEYDRHVYDGQNWKYLNLPMPEIANMAIASIKDSTMMYFSCDVAKFLDRDKGYMDINNYDYGALFGTTFGMDKKERISTYASGSSHAMTLCGVDLDANGKPTKWMVENSWGSNRGHNGFLIMTDQWFNEYMFRLVVESKYIPSATLKLFDQKPILLPAWDPLFAPEE